MFLSPWQPLLRAGTLWWCKADDSSLISAYVDLTHEVSILMQFAATGGHVTYQIAPASITNENEGW